MKLIKGFEVVFTTDKVDYQSAGVFETKEQAENIKNYIYAAEEVDNVFVLDWEGCEPEEVEAYEFE